MKAIETIYKGYRFRSRLEARWAVFFDAMGIKWEYETEGFELSGGGRYLPDFKVFSPQGMITWYEIKPVGYSGETKIERFKADYEKENGLENLMHDTSFEILMGDPFTVLADKLNICPRCGIISQVDSDTNGIEHYYSCYPCDSNTPCGGDQSEEIGVFVTVRPHKGVVVVEGTEHDRFVSLVQKACKAARSARFEFGESGGRI